MLPRSGEPIKKLGDHEIELRLHPQVTTTLKVRVESTTPVIQPAAEAAPAAAPEASKEPTEAKKERGDRERKPKAPRAEKKAS